MRECGFLSSPPALYKGARWGLGRPAQRIKARDEQGVGANPLPLLATARVNRGVVGEIVCGCAGLSPSSMRQATMMGMVHALLPKRR